MDGPHRRHRVAQRRRVEGQQHRQQMDLGGRRRQMAPVARRLVLVVAQQIERPGVGVRQPGGQTQLQYGADGARKEQAVRDGGAQDSQRDLLDARDRDVEDQLGMAHRGKADQGGGIAGQHHDIGPRRAVEQRNEETNADPHRQHETQQERRVDQRRQHGDAERGARKGAYHAEDRLGAHAAGQGLAGDIDGQHRPIGARQIEAEADHQRQRGRGEAINGKQHRDAVWPGHPPHPFSAVSPLNAASNPLSAVSVVSRSSSLICHNKRLLAPTITVSIAMA